MWIHWTNCGGSFIGSIAGNAIEKLPAAERGCFFFHSAARRNAIWGLPPWNFADYFRGECFASSSRGDWLVISGFRGTSGSFGGSSNDLSLRNLVARELVWGDLIFIEGIVVNGMLKELLEM